MRYEIESTCIYITQLQIISPSTSGHMIGPWTCDLPKRARIRAQLTNLGFFSKRVPMPWISWKNSVSRSDNTLGE
jgi:hypothetical protein